VVSSNYDARICQIDKKTSKVLYRELKELRLGTQ
jgi:hypothetical protein